MGGAADTAKDFVKKSADPKYAGPAMLGAGTYAAAELTEDIANERSQQKEATKQAEEAARMAEETRVAEEEAAAEDERRRRMNIFQTGGGSSGQEVLSVRQSRGNIFGN